MHKLLLTLSVYALFLIGCDDGSPSHSGAIAADTPATQTLVATRYTDVDPVCGMVRDSTWTDYTLYNGDTMWFCAAPEMKAFQANPAKYLNATRIDSSHDHHQ